MLFPKPHVHTTKEAVSISKEWVMVLILYSTVHEFLYDTGTAYKQK